MCDERPRVSRRAIPTPLQAAALPRRSGWERATGVSPVGTVGQHRGLGVPGAVQTWAWGLTGTKTGNQSRGKGQHHLKKHDMGEKQLLSQLWRRKQTVKNRQRIFLLIKRSPDFIPAEHRRVGASHTEGCARSTPGWGGCSRSMQGGHAQMVQAGRPNRLWESTFQAALGGSV